MADLSREESKRLRAELALGLGLLSQRVWPPRTLPGTASTSLSARRGRKPVNAMGGVRANTSGASGITSRKNGVAPEIETQGRASVADLYE